MTTELPILTGTDKQAAWATDIRRQVLRDLDTTDRVYDAATTSNRTGLSVADLPQFADWLAGHTAASWWIDNIGTNSVGQRLRDITSLRHIGRTWRDETGR
jgi:hypothetical protein